MHRAIYGRVFHRRFGLSREKRSRVSVFAHAEKNQIQHRRLMPDERRAGADLLVGFCGSDFRPIFAPHSVDLLCADPQRLEQQFPGEPEIALRIVRRNAALVGPEEMNVIECDCAKVCMFHRSTEKRVGYSSPRERNGVRSVRSIHSLNLVQPCPSNRPGQFVSVGKRNQFKRLFSVRSRVLR